MEGPVLLLVLLLSVLLIVVMTSGVRLHPFIVLLLGVITMLSVYLLSLIAGV